MTVRDITECSQGYLSKFIGLSSDTKPTAHVTDGSSFLEIDVGGQWIFLNGSWVKVPSNSLDLIADIEIDGTPVTNRRFAAAASGDNTLLSVATGSRVKLYKALLSVSSDISGEVILKVGSSQVGSIYNPKTGSQYVLLSSFPDFEYGADGDDLVLNLPSATSVSCNISYEVTTP